MYDCICVVLSYSINVFVPVLKMRSHAAVWSCHVLVLRLLWSSTGVTIIMPKVLIIYRGRQRGQNKGEKWGGVKSNHRHPHWKSLMQSFSRSFFLPPLPCETSVSLHLSSLDCGCYWFSPASPSKYSEQWAAASLAAVQPTNLMNCDVSTGSVSLTYHSKCPLL